MQNDTRVAVDLAKSVFELAVSDRPGRVARQARLPRSRFLTFFAQQPAANVIMEACGSAHYWGRRIEQLGHRVTLLPPHQVRPYVRRNKTDRTDAKGILEASRNEDIHAVPVKTVAQQALTALHRLRAGWMTESGIEPTRRAFAVPASGRGCCARRRPRSPLSARFSPCGGICEHDRCLQGLRSKTRVRSITGTAKLS